MKLITKYILIIIVLFYACKKEIKDNEEIKIIELDTIIRIKDYVEPNYPKKPSGRYLLNIYYKYPVYPASSNFPFESGIKVEFFYNSKNYLDYFKIYGFEANSQGRLTKIEYDSNGLVTIIKYFNLNNIITQLEKFDYNANEKLIRISSYKKIENQEKYELDCYSDFKYPNSDTIIEYRYLKYYFFKKPFKDVYIYDNKRNVKEKQYFSYNAIYPYSSEDFYYNDKKRAFDNVGLPLYEISYDGFQLSEVFSVNHKIGSQSFSYDNEVKYEFGEKTISNFEYDSLGFPVSKDSIIFHRYIDLN